MHSQVSTEENIRCRAEKYLDEYDHKLHEINRQLTDLQGEGQNLVELRTPPSLSSHYGGEIPGQFKMP